MLQGEKHSLIVTGGAGFIGSGFVELCARQGYKTIVLDALTYAGYRDNLSALEREGLVHFVHGNICDGPLARKLLAEHKPQALINFAAESHVDRSIDSPSAFIETNILGTFTLLGASLEHWQSLSDKSSFRYVQISTDEVYGSLGESGKFTETSPLAPNSPYSASKASADLLVRAWHHTYGLPTVTTNCSNNYGPRQFPEKLIPHMIHCALNDKPLPVYGDGKNIRDWIHVEDHCRGLLLALEKGKLGETYCFGGNAERNNVEVVQTIVSLLDKLRPRKDGKSYSAQIQFVKDRLGHDRRYAIDGGKAEKELGFNPKYSFEKGLEETVRWYLDHAAWVQGVLAQGKS
jgi:dTDP-glucose 4,6-dehydratase